MEKYTVYSRENEVLIFSWCISIKSSLLEVYSQFLLLRSLIMLIQDIFMKKSVVLLDLIFPFICPVEWFGPLKIHQFFLSCLAKVLRTV